MKEIDPTKQLSDIVMFNGASNVQLAGRLLNVYYTKLTVIRCVEHTVPLFFNDFRVTIVNQIISPHKMIYNCLVLVYIKSIVTYLNINIKSFAIKTLFFFRRN